MLLSPAQLSKLDALSLHARRAFTGASKGEKRSTRRGSSVEFADFRAYNAGDDIRRIDWNAYARFDRLFLKMFLEEEDLDVTILIDASASMGFGEPEKFRSALQLAGAIGYIGLSNFDRISCATWGEGLRAQFPPTRGKAAASRLFSFLEAQKVEGTTDFSAAMRRVALGARRAGIAFVISDFLMPEGYEGGLKMLAARGFEVTAVQLLARDEIEPSLVGDFKLVDVETRAEKEISVSASLLRTYRAHLDDYTHRLRTLCLRYGMNFVQVGSDTPTEEIVGRMMRGLGVVK